MDCGMLGACRWAASTALRDLGWLESSATGPAAGGPAAAKSTTRGAAAEALAQAEVARGKVDKAQAAVQQVGCGNLLRLGDPLHTLSV